MNLRALGARLRSARESVGMSQEETASQLGVSQSAYSHFERGSRELGIVYLEPLAKILGITVAHLLGISTTAGLTPLEDEMLGCFRDIPEPLQQYFVETCHIYADRAQEVMAQEEAAAARRALAQGDTPEDD